MSVMSKQRFNLDDSGATFPPSEPRTPAYRHKLRLENHTAGPEWQDGAAQQWTERTPTGRTTVTCRCGLDTGAVPTNEARLVYEEHRNLIRDEITADLRF
ncbi:hypothetical protein GCM10010371_03650 [Streptomyces subrutilus]|nr:hypothetical protein GCM10010371_03650 [Streptomyces subrutilus]